MADNLARGYAAAGHEVLVLTAAYPGAPERETGAGFEIVRLPAVSLPQTRLSVSFDIAFTIRPSLLRAVDRELTSFNPDVIHQHGQFFDLTWATGWWAGRRDVPVLLSIHTRLESPNKGYGAVFHGLDAALVAPALRTYRPRVVVMDVLMRDYIADRYHRVVRDTIAIPVGVDPEWVLGGDPTRMRREWGLEGRPVVVSLGHVIPLRDRVALVNAIPGILNRHPDLAVVVVGTVYYDAFLKRAEELAVSHVINAVGAVPKSDVPDVLAAADLETHDLQGYGLGTASLESMAAGVPVVAAVRPDNFPGITLRDGLDVVLVPQDDPNALSRAVNNILDDPAAARARMAPNQQALIAEHFTLASMTRQYLAALADLVR